MLAAAAELVEPCLSSTSSPHLPIFKEIRKILCSHLTVHTLVVPFYVTLLCNFCIDKNTFTHSDPWLNTVQ